jgi:hypothetical protein
MNRIAIKAKIRYIFIMIIWCSILIR